MAEDDITMDCAKCEVRIRREERGRIRKDLHEIEFKANGATDFVNKIMDYIKQALTEG